MNTFLDTLPIAHRGLHDEKRPENSLAAFEAAIEAGYAIETDVRFTGDGALVIFHDDELLRMAGDPRRVGGCTLETLKSLRLMGTEEKIPSFSEFLETVGGRVPLLIEIKDMEGVKGKQIAEAVAMAMEGYRGEYAIQSFNPFYVRAYKRLRPDVPCGVLSHWDMKEERKGLAWRFKAYLLSHLKLNFLVKPDFVSYGFWALPKKCVTKFKGAKLAWTIRSEADEAKARKYADNIIFETYLAKK